MTRAPSLAEQEGGGRTPVSVDRTHPSGWVRTAWWRRRDPAARSLGGAGS